jgi:hypothetical protein
MDANIKVDKTPEGGIDMSKDYSDNPLAVGMVIVLCIIGLMAFGFCVFDFLLPIPSKVEESKLPETYRLLEKLDKGEFSTYPKMRKLYPELISIDPSDRFSRVESEINYDIKYGDGNANIICLPYKKDVTSTPVMVLINNKAGENVRVMLDADDFSSKAELNFFVKACEENAHKILSDKKVWD